MNFKESSIVLNALPGVGSATIKKLIEALITPQAVFKAKSSELHKIPSISPKIIEAILHWEDNFDLSKELSELTASGFSYISIEEEVYPQNLKEIYDAPLGLYVWGKLLKKDAQAIGIVGTRQSSYYGDKMAQKFSYQLAQSNWTIVSGMARGIDTQAHLGALAADGRTIAFIGSGLLSLYPKENQSLAEKIAQNSGAVISEFPLHYPPSKHTFPRRNRLISGSSKGLIVVESKEKSGALITANQSNEFGRSVYAIPGPLDKPNFAGNHNLIRQGATLLTSAEDIMEDFRFSFEKSAPNDHPKQMAHLNKQEILLLNQLSYHESSMESLIEQSSLPFSEVLSLLSSLEIKGLAKQLPGQLFVKI